MGIYGKCKYCGNARIVSKEISEEEPTTVTQEELDEWASQECDCAGAEHARKKAADRETAEAYIDDLVDKDDVAAELKNFIPLLQECKIDGVVVKINEKTKITLATKTSGALKVARVDTLKTEYENE